VKRVLFLDYFFPPLASDWRGAAFAKLLPQFGWQPIVISAHESARYQKDYDLLKEIPKDLEVHRVPHQEPNMILQRFRYKLKIAADFPDYYRTWYFPAYDEARKILQKEEVDLIYSASPTFTTALVAMRLKSEFNIPWVADFNDGWAVNDFLNLELDRTLIRPLRWLQQRRIRKAEAAILQSADKIVIVHWHVKERWCRLHAINGAKICVITEGYDESVFRGLKPRSLYPERLTIVFLGNFYPAYREIFMKFAHAVTEIDKNAELVFIGRAGAAVQEMNLPNSTCILPLPRQKAIEFALGSHFLLLVMPPYAKWIPAKTFDYLRIGKPILAIVPGDGDPARIVRESGGGFLLPFDKQQMKEELKTIFDKWRSGNLERFQPNRDYVIRYERRKITQEMVHVFDEASS